MAASVAGEVIDSATDRVRLHHAWRAPDSGAPVPGEPHFPLKHAAVRDINGTIRRDGPGGRS